MIKLCFNNATNNVVVLCRLHYINTLKQELDGSWAYKETYSDEISVFNAHVNESPVSFFCFCLCQGRPRQASSDELVTYASQKTV